MIEPLSNRTWVPYRPAYAHVPSTAYPQHHRASPLVYAAPGVRPAPPTHVSDAEDSANRITEPITVRLWNAWYALKYTWHWGSVCSHVHRSAWHSISTKSRPARRCVACGRTEFR